MSVDEARGYLERARADAGGTAADRAGVAAAVATLAAAGEAEAANELAATTWRHWFLDGDLAGARELLAAALAVGGPSEWRARTLYADGMCAFRQGDQAESRARNEEALAVAREAGDPRGEVDALVGLARVAFRDGDYARVRELAARAREVAREIDDPAAESAPLHMLAAGHRLDGDYERARALYTENLELNARLGHASSVSMEHHNLGWIALHLDDVEGAEEHFAQVEEEESAYGDAWRDVNAAAVALARERRDEAKELFAAGERTLAENDIVADPDDAAELEWLRARLGE